LNDESFEYLSSSCALLILAIALAAGCSRSESSAKQENNQNQNKAVKVSVLRVEPAPMKDVLVLPERLKRGKTCASLPMRRGASSGLGRKRARLERRGSDCEIDVAALKAACDRAEAALKLAEDLCDRRSKLFEKKTSSTRRNWTKAKQRELSPGPTSGKCRSSTNGAF